MSETIYSHIHRLIANDHTERSIRDLEVSLRSKDNDLHQQVIIIAHKFRALEKQKRLGTINQEDASLQIAKVNHGLLEIAEEASEEIPLRLSNVVHPSYILRKPWYKRYSFAILMGMYAVLAAICFMLLEIPQQRLLTEVDLYANRVSFHIAGSGNFLLNQTIEETRIQQFERIIIPSRKAQLDLNLDGQMDADQDIESGLEISPKISGSVVSFDQVGIEELYFSNGTQFIFTLAPEDEGSLLLDVINPDTNYGALGFRDSSTFFTMNEVLAKGWDAPEDVQYAEGLIFDYGRPIRFIGKDKTIRLEIFNGNALNFEKEEGAIDSLRFFESQAGKPESSIISGKVHMLTDENEIFDSLNIDPGEFFIIATAGPLRMESLTITSKNIHLKAQGYIRQMGWGNNIDELKRQNPSLLRWWWHNHRYKFIFLMMVLGTATIMLSQRWLKGW